MKRVLILHPSMKAEVDRLVAEPFPEPKDAELRAVLSQADIHYVGHVGHVQGTRLQRGVRPNLFAEFPEQTMRKLIGEKP